MVTSIYDGRAAGLDTGSGRWQVVCETHGATLATRTRAEARSARSIPAEWCDECAENHHSEES